MKNGRNESRILAAGMVIAGLAGLAPSALAREARPKDTREIQALYEAGKPAEARAAMQYRVDVELRKVAGIGRVHDMDSAWGKVDRGLLMNCLCIAFHRERKMNPKALPPELLFKLSQRVIAQFDRGLAEVGKWKNLDIVGRSVGYGIVCKLNLLSVQIEILRDLRQAKRAAALAEKHKEFFKLVSVDTEGLLDPEKKRRYRARTQNHRGLIAVSWADGEGNKGELLDVQWPMGDK